MLFYFYVLIDLIAGFALFSGKKKEKGEDEERHRLQLKSQLPVDHEPNLGRLRYALDLALGLAQSGHHSK